MKASEAQVGGRHYKKLPIQPMQYSLENNLNAAQHTAIKYITRHRDGGGRKDLYKAIHCVLLLLEHEYEWKLGDDALVTALTNAALGLPAGESA